MPALGAPPALRVFGVTKRFGAVVANKDISLDVARGEIHAIVGENGAGKSTLMSILMGMVTPDAGEIFVDGVRARIRSPRDAAALGLGMVHQHFMLVDTLDVLDNVMLGAEGGALLAAGRRPVAGAAGHGRVTEAALAATGRRYAAARQSKAVKICYLQLFKVKWLGAILAHGPARASRSVCIHDSSIKTALTK